MLCLTLLSLKQVCVGLDVSLLILGLLNSWEVLGHESSVILSKLFALFFVQLLSRCELLSEPLVVGLGILESFLEVNEGFSGELSGLLARVWDFMNLNASGNFLDLTSFSGHVELHFQGHCKELLGRGSDSISFELEELLNEHGSLALWVGHTWHLGVWWVLNRVLEFHGLGLALLV